MKVSYLSVSANNHLLKGRFFEFLACLFLLCKGYVPIAQNVKLRVAEVDILARKRNKLVIVEVKYRKSKNAAEYAVHPAQQKRLLNAASVLMAQNIWADEIRVDTIFFFKCIPFVKHVQNAFTLS